MNVGEGLEVVLSQFGMVFLGDTAESDLLRTSEHSSLAYPLYYNYSVLGINKI